MNYGIRELPIKGFSSVCDGGKSAAHTKFVKLKNDLIGVSIRKMKESEYGALAGFLYEAIYVPEGMEAPPREIINRPELKVYIADFGRHRGDHCLGAYISDEIVGAVWVRIMNDYGHIDDDTPSFAISVHKEYRGKGIGTALMRAMLGLLKEEGYKRASLAVQKENYALKMYRGLGFEAVNENEEEYIMVCRL